MTIDQTIYNNSAPPNPSLRQPKYRRPDTSHIPNALPELKGFIIDTSFYRNGAFVIAAGVLTRIDPNGTIYLAPVRETHNMFVTQPDAEEISVSRKELLYAEVVGCTRNYSSADKQYFPKSEVKVLDL